MNQEVSVNRAGNIRNHSHLWRHITQDEYILDIVENGLKLNFKDEVPSNSPFEHKLSARDSDTISREISKLLDKGVITISKYENNDFFSSLFVRPKKDGKFRTILNLKQLNSECDTYHFKMESMKHVVNMITPGCYLASLDIRDAFYSVPIFDKHKRFLKFSWKGIVYQFEVMPNGYVDAMRVFTKVLKPVFAYLRERGHSSVIYVDDSLLKGDSYQECLENIEITKQLLEDLGFYVHYDKSVLIPTRKIVFLGFDIDTVNMTVSLTVEKKQKIKDYCIKLLTKSTVSIREVAKLLGNIAASFEGVEHGRLFFRNLEHDKIISLKTAKGNFEAVCQISEEGRRDIEWWRDNIIHASKSLYPIPEVDYTIFTDASNDGWGINNEKETVNNRWSEEETEMHINERELKAVHLAVLSFRRDITSKKHVRVMSDNSTAIAYINNKGGCKSRVCNKLSQDIWQFCISHKVHISAAHIPGIHNVIADKASRQFIDSAEWMLDPKIFDLLCREFGVPDIDLFATSMNKQLDRYVSWKPDPYSENIDAMSVPWNNYYCYIFPPFSMMWPILRKIRQQSNKALVIAPLWPTQTWFTSLLQLAIHQPIIISSKHLKLPGTKKMHPLCQKMKLIAVCCSKSLAEQQNFRAKHPKYCQLHGGNEHIASMRRPLKDSQSFVVKGTLISGRRL